MTTTDLSTTGRAQRQRRRLGDVLFAAGAQGSGILILAILAGVAAFLILQSFDSLDANQANFLTSSEWDANTREEPSFGVAALAFGTVLAAAIAGLLIVSGCGSDTTTRRTVTAVVTLSSGAVPSGSDAADASAPASGSAASGEPASGDPSAASPSPSAVTSPACPGLP